MSFYRNLFRRARGTERDLENERKRLKDRLQILMNLRVGQYRTSIELAHELSLHPDLIDDAKKHASESLKEINNILEMQEPNEENRVSLISLKKEFVDFLKETMSNL